MSLPLINTMLNSTAFVFMLAAYVAIKTGRPRLHAALMTAAIVSSAAFLTCYLIYHFAGDPISYTGSVPYVYYTILVTHILLAATVPFLVGYVVYRALRGELEQHRRVARIALPIWAYVSLTGVVIYLFVHL